MREILSRQKGEAFLGFIGFFHLPSDDYRNVGDARTKGGGSTMLKEPLRATTCFSLGFQESQK